MSSSSSESSNKFPRSPEIFTAFSLVKSRLPVGALILVPNEQCSNYIICNTNVPIPVSAVPSIKPPDDNNIMSLQLQVPVVESYIDMVRSNGSSYL